MNTRTKTTGTPSVIAPTQSGADATVSPKNIPSDTARETSGGTMLDMSNVGLHSVSASVFSRTELTSLNLSHNQLSGALPAEVRHLSNLTTLDLSYNNFTGVPAEIGQLSSLTTLNLSHNLITGLPLELGNLSHLEVLNLSGTEYSKADLDQIRAKLPSTTVVITE